MAGQDNFKPSQGQQVKVMGGSLSQVTPAGLGRNSGQQVQVSVQGMQQAPIQHQSPIGSANTPKGAQPVSIVGQMNAQLGTPIAPPAPKLPLSPSAQIHALGMTSDDMEIHEISVEGEAPNGRKYVAPFDAHFPRGTKILGVTDKIK